MEILTERVVFLARGRVVANDTPASIASAFGHDDLEGVFLALAGSDAGGDLMNGRRVKTVVRRHAYVLKRSPHRFFDVTVWPLLDVLLFGSLGAYVAQQDGASEAGAPYLLAGILMFHVLYQLQIAVCTGFMEETWSRNVLNILTTPVTEAEYILGVALFGLAKLVLAMAALTVMAIAFFGFNLTSVGWGLVPITFVLLLAGWSIGMAVIGLMLRYGQSAEILAWGINFLVMALSGVFNPVDAIPAAAAAHLAHPAHHARLHRVARRCSTANRCRGTRSSPACSALSSARPSPSGTPPACCIRSDGGASSPGSPRGASPDARRALRRGRRASRAPGAGGAGGLVQHRDLYGSVAAALARAAVVAAAIAGTAVVLAAVPGTAVVVGMILRRRRRRPGDGGRRRVVVAARTTAAVVIVVVVDGGRRRARHRRRCDVVVAVLVGGLRDDVAVVGTWRRFASHLGDILAVIAAVAVDRRRGVSSSSIEVEVVSSSIEVAVVSLELGGVDAATEGWVVTEVLVLVDDAVDGLVLDAGCAGISTRLSEPPLSTLAAAAVTPPTMRAAATPTAASLRECLVIGTGAIPS